MTGWGKYRFWTTFTCGKCQCTKVRLDVMSHRGYLSWSLEPWWWQLKWWFNGLQESDLPEKRGEIIDVTPHHSPTPPTPPIRPSVKYSCTGVRLVIMSWQSYWCWWQYGRVAGVFRDASSRFCLRGPFANERERRWTQQWVVGVFVPSWMILFFPCKS